MFKSFLVCTVLPRAVSSRYCLLGGMSECNSANPKRWGLDSIGVLAFVSILTNSEQACLLSSEALLTQGCTVLSKSERSCPLQVNLPRLQPVWPNAFSSSKQSSYCSPLLLRTINTQSHISCVQNNQFDQLQHQQEHFPPRNNHCTKVHFNTKQDFMCRTTSLTNCSASGFSSTKTIIALQSTELYSSSQNNAWRYLVHYIVYKTTSLTTAARAMHFQSLHYSTYTIA